VSAATYVASNVVIGSGFYESACPARGTSSVWMRLTEVQRLRGRVLLRWFCPSCEHVWDVVSERPVMPKASLKPPSRAIRKTRSK
jgi:hypothetical protein